MRTFDDSIREEIERDPSFAELFALAQAELRLGMALYARREALGLTQQQVAEAAGIAPSMLKSYEKAGRTLKVTTLWKLAEALGVEIRLTPGLGVELVAAQPPTTAEAEPTSEAQAPAHTSDGDESHVKHTAAPRTRPTRAGQPA